MNYRVGTHGAFLAAMKARLTTMMVEVPRPDGTGSVTVTPLRRLTTRADDDFSIALLDGWATVADVLTFYQERIANEGFLRTATERRSILELARLIGYALRPGVAASVYLAYTIDEKQTTPALIPAGARSQSVPGPGESPQSFETSEPLAARADWNNLQVRLTQPQNITLANVLSLAQIYVAGSLTKLKPGDPLLFVFGDADSTSVLRTVQSADGQFERNRTLIQFQPVSSPIIAALPVLAGFVAAVQPLLTPSTSGAGQRLVGRAEDILTQTYLGRASVPADWAGTIRNAADGTPEPAILNAYLGFAETLGTALKNLPGPPAPVFTDPSAFVNPLLHPRIMQPAGSLQLTRSLRTAFTAGADANPQLLVKFAPELRATFYHAWATATVDRTPPALQGVFALRAEAAPFGANAPRIPTYDANKNLKNPSLWDEWPLDGAEDTNVLFLDQAYDAISPSSYVLIQQGAGSNLTRDVRRVADAQTVQRSAYGISGKSTRLTLTSDWHGAAADLSTLRRVLIRAKSEPLTLAEEAITSDVSGQEVPLDRLHDALPSGRWVILSGERTDIPGVTGVRATELLMLAAVRQDFDPTLPGDKTHSTLQLATPMAFTYRRDTVRINGNVVKATNGETRNETLGNGNGAQPLQTFTLKQPPLTFVPTPAGAASTLQVFVNAVQWHEADTIAGLGPKDRAFVTKTDDEGKISVMFGDGEHGARVPTGLANVAATYRNGIGSGGNVKAGQISLLQSRPLGVKAVINPLAATGGANAENRDQARENAPLALMALDRLVSVRDYADFTRTFAGIGKAAARKLSDSHRQLVHVTIAGADDIPIDASSDLDRNLLLALRRFGDVDLPVVVQSRELVALVLSAKIRVTSDYQWDAVATAVRSTLLDAFGFQQRALGQAVQLSEVISAIQNTPGVEYVDVDAFGGVPEKIALADGTRRFLTLDELALSVQRAANPRKFQISGAFRSRLTAGPADRVPANLADFENGGLRPAQLAIFTADIADTLILNEIK